MPLKKQEIYKNWTKFFRAEELSVLMDVCTRCTLTKLLVKMLDGNYTMMLCAVLDKSWKQHPFCQKKKKLQNGHLPSLLTKHPSQVN